MPAHFRIDRSLGLVVSVGEGVVNERELLQHAEELRAHPDFHPDLRQFIDGSGITKLDVSAACIRSDAASSRFSTDARRAILVSSVFAFGLGRMYSMLVRGGGTAAIHVCRKEQDALDWLGIERQGDWFRDCATP
ncbi:MAG: hypothetical protein HRU17_16200 [Polyangiaceae bacterium]|nr:hypothetical protein [Polyangiaceae bacterium]